MAKVSTKAFVKLREFVKNVPRAMDDRTTQLIALTVKQRMLNFIARGISPILGQERFPAYKRANPGRGKEKKGYPYNTKEFRRGTKRVRPVNLHLTGEFLDSLRSRGRNAVITIDFSSKKSQLKEQGHREGVGGQPKRPIIPSDDEEFNATIKLEILKMMKTAVRALIKRGV